MPVKIAVRAWGMKSFAQSRCRRARSAGLFWLSPVYPAFIEWLLWPGSWGWRHSLAEGLPRAVTDCPLCSWQSGAPWESLSLSQGGAPFQSWAVRWEESLKSSMVPRVGGGGPVTSSNP